MSQISCFPNRQAGGLLHVTHQCSRFSSHSQVTSALATRLDLGRKLVHRLLMNLIIEIRPVVVVGRSVPIWQVVVCCFFFFLIHNPSPPLSLFLSWVFEVAETQGRYLEGEPAPFLSIPRTIISLKMIALPRRSNQLCLLILCSSGFAFLLLFFLFTQREYIRIPTSSALQWHPKPNGGGVQLDIDLPVPVNHGSEDKDNDDFELDTGDAGDYTSGESRPAPKPQAHTDGFLASTQKETTIPSTVSVSDPSVRVEAHVYGFTLFDRLYLWNGTLFVVTKDVASFPPRDRILFKSEGLLGGVGVDVMDQVRLCYHSQGIFCLS